MTNWERSWNWWKRLRQVFNTSYFLARRQQNYETQFKNKKISDSELLIAPPKEQGEPIATQTENTVQCDFEVQANISRESNTIATQTREDTIEEISLPAKKRKLSLISVGQLQPPKAIFDAAIQTISTDRSDGSCQTNDPERTDFQAQAHFEKQGEPIGTQTESSEKCDREVQANIQQESELSPPLVPDPTMKKEISMPNIQSSMAQTPKFYNANQNDRKNKTEKQKKVKLK